MPRTVRQTPSNMHLRATFDGRRVMANHDELVPKGCECPECGESVTDMIHFLMGYEDKVQCQSCGHEYWLIYPPRPDQQSRLEREAATREAIRDILGDALCQNLR